MDEFSEAIEADEYDITLLVGWSWIIGNEYVDSHFTVVLHSSDLPDYAGGSPIQHQIIDGLQETKATLFQATSKLDLGPIIDKERFSLTGNLRQVLNGLENASFEILNRFIRNYPNYSLTKQLTHTVRKRRTPDMSEITIEELKTSTSEQLYNKIRALQDPYPNAFIVCKDGSKLYLRESKSE